MDNYLFNHFTKQSSAAIRNLAKAIKPSVLQRPETVKELTTLAKFKNANPAVSRFQMADGVPGVNPEVTDALGHETLKQIKRMLGTNEAQQTALAGRVTPQNITDANIINRMSQLTGRNDYLQDLLSRYYS